MKLFPGALCLAVLLLLLPMPLPSVETGTTRAAQTEAKPKPAAPKATKTPASKSTTAKADGATSKPLAAKPAEGVVYANSPNLYVRDSPSAKAARLDSVSDPRPFTVFEEFTEPSGNKWLHVRYSNDKDSLNGWVQLKYTTSDKSKAYSEGASKSDTTKAGSSKAGAASADTGSTTPIVIKPAEGIVYVKGSSVISRETPTAKGAKVNYLSELTALTIFEEGVEGAGEKWLHVKYQNGKNIASGWVLAKYTVADRTELLDPKFRALDYSPQKKVAEYPENPRIKVNGIYVTYSSIGTPKKLEALLAFAAKSRINTFVIDVKEDAGLMTFKTLAAEKYAPSANKHPTVNNMAALMKRLKDLNLYTIARIVCFKDPEYADQHPDRNIIYRADGKPYKQRDGLRWASAFDRELWDYNIAVAKEAAQAGFNEIQFDYVRFPETDPKTKDPLLDMRNTLNETKPEAIQKFLKKAYAEISPLHVYVGADIFGLIPTSPTDERIGQYWEAISNVVDYVCPMMYPSHYANQTYKIPIPDANPYECVWYCTRDCVNRNKNIPTPARIRPWIQDFTAPWVNGHVKYGEAQIRDEIRALKEHGIEEFMLWNAFNNYTESALTK